MRLAAIALARLYDALGRLLFFGAVASCGFLFGSDLLAWLKTARWPHDTAADALARLGWAHPQSSWLGLQKVLDAVPLWQAAPEFCFAGLLLLLAGRGVTLTLWAWALGVRARFGAAAQGAAARLSQAKASRTITSRPS